MVPAFPNLDFDRFHLFELPARLASGNGRIAAADLVGAPAIGFQLAAREGGYTYSAADDDVTVRPGTGGAQTVVELSHRDWQDLVYELRSVFGLLYGGNLRFVRGRFDDLERWAPALRAMISGRAIYDEAALDLRDLRGEPLELARSFTLDEDPVELGHFLRTAGFLHLRSVYAPGEIAAFAAEVDRLSRAARPGDDRSWWAANATGEPVLCRLTYANERSALFADLHEDERPRSIAALSGESLRCSPDRMEGHSVVIKVPNAVGGLADLPWHEDCGLGGHSIMCPAILIGVQLDDMTEESGSMHVRAGSAGASCHMTMLGRQRGRLEVALNARAGDCTVHFADVLHAAPPPRAGGRGRRTLYMNYFNPRLFEFVGPGRAYNDVLARAADGVVRSVGEVLSDENP